jgi:hypothetical protein
MILDDEALCLLRACCVASGDEAVEAVKELLKRERAVDRSTAPQVLSKRLPFCKSLVARNVLYGAPTTNLAVRARNVAVEERSLALLFVAEAGKLVHRRTPALTRTWASSLLALQGTSRRHFADR